MGETKRGALIIFEGLDRSGKSTQYLRSKGRTVEFIPFPDRSTPIGKLIDMYLRREIDMSEEALHLLFCANRRERVDFIQECISTGIDVVCDRYAYSGVAYSLAKGLPADWVRAGDVGMPQPDVVLFFEVSPEVACQRGGFGEERLETGELQRKVRETMKLLRKPFWQMVNADGDVQTVEGEVRAIVDHLDLHLPLQLLDQI
ncbi:unnamed protein product, partial [Mesorhabditis belari]|uniref:dTMP kinase n=1 Tax=Mesorhabditis belari TaxID=2138241 RepID=A0AAF3F5G2_9BILA